MAFLGVITSKKIMLTNPIFYPQTRSAMQTSRQKSGFRQVQQVYGQVMRAFGETVWIMVWITPILALIFGKISLISPLTNVLVLGLVGVVSVIGTVGIIIGLWWLALGKIILWLTIPTLTYLRKVAEIGGGSSGLQIEFNWWILVGYYLILFYFLLKNKIKNY